MSHIHKPHSGSLQAGFTIVELLIATLVFSLILLVITYGVLHFTNSYYKGLNTSMTQNAAQSAIDTIVQAVEFSESGTTVSDNTHFCAGTKMFVYDAGKAFAGGTPAAGNRGLYMMDANSSCTDPGGATGGTELLGKNMRVADIKVSKSNAADISDPNIPWQISLRIAYGDSDLLCSAHLNSSPGGCNAGDASMASSAAFAADDMRCKSTVGAQFCSVATLTAVAQQRIILNSTGP